MDIATKLKHHFDNKKYGKLQRKLGEDDIEMRKGYIVDISENFVLLQETDDFELDGYLIIPIQTITGLIYTNSDKYYDKIMKWEGLTDTAQNRHKIDLTSWQTIFKSIKKIGLNVIVENENPYDDSFDIGPITKVTTAAVYIRYFNPSGILDKEATKITWDKITIAQFDSRYINTFSKYLREQKDKNEKQL